MLDRYCEDDPNPAHGAAAGVTTLGILIAEVENAFVSALTKVVVASTSTNVLGEYEFQLPPGTYTVCKSLPPGWRQTFPGAGLGSASRTGSGTGLGLRGHVVILADSGQLASADFGNMSFSSGIAALR